ncbi:divalent-cation tolerance protein CutA [Qipengyuania sediminis]|uniref:divalent-cation tolerance protein CutA n=1 Tax=Qipengyuania sediminis TaxID=1532023 RepID=UPI001F0CFD10|nr:divalent-cation tolerance protein CutA [Qipengyuania sediminis]
MSEAAALIWCPFPDEAEARAAITTLLDERLIACGNILPGMTSLFAWQGERDEANECGALFKTTAALLSAAMSRIAAIHPYQTPAVLGWGVQASGSTQSWLNSETGPQT